MENQKENKEKNINKILYGISIWKRSFFPAFLEKNSKLTYIALGKDKSLKEENFKGVNEIIIWGKAQSEYLENVSKEKNIPITRVEDGFLRSVNLGVNKAIPSSLCFDKTGIYYDATSESDLENLLNSYEVSSEEIETSKKMIAKIIEKKISKYNSAPHKNFNKIFGKKKKERILVIGQVETDMSLKYGCQKKMSNNDLVRLAREENPEAEIFYKIHPDILGKDIDNPKEVEDMCRIIDISISADSVLETMDKVYTMTSLMGMEALIRGKEVICIGAPFYSNWGLTDDRQIEKRRNKNRTVEELFAIAYLVYPTYINIHTKRQCTPEEALDNLIRDYESIIVNGNKDETIQKHGRSIYWYIKTIYKSIKNKITN